MKNTIGDSVFVAPSECPACGKVCDAATGINCSGGPKPGDSTVCIECGAISLFDTALKLELVPDVQAKADPTLEDCRKIQKLIRKQLGLPVNP